uniref:Uncharacterized protein n=1 Tax=Rhizophora mucronata TaxID=61149 RepID=A0A2P2N9B5_RHIMU
MFSCSKLIFPMKFGISPDMQFSLMSIIDSLG